MASAKEPAKVELAQVKPLMITTLSQVQEMVNKPRTMEVTLNKQRIGIACRALTPAETSLVDQIRAEPIPPMVRAPGDDRTQDTFDAMDPVYRAKKELCDREAQCVAVYFGCPLYRELKPELYSLEKPNRSAIRELVEGQLSMDLLLQIYQAVIQPVTDLDAQVSFA